jgi:hypothetical protein
MWQIAKVFLMVIIIKKKVNSFSFVDQQFKLTLSGIQCGGLLIYVNVVSI